MTRLQPTIALSVDGSAYARRAVLANVGWCALFLPLVLMAWRESHFQYDLYLPGQSGEIAAGSMFLLAIAVATMIAALGWYRTYPRTLVIACGSYIGLTLFHLVVQYALDAEPKFTVALRAVIFAVLMLPIVAQRRVLVRFVSLNFALGVVLIALNTVTFAHWLRLIALPFRQVPRVGGDANQFLLNPLHFGWFGLTENYVYPGHPLNMPRLQGFSLEPIHWSYFVLLTLAMGLFLMAESGPARRSAVVGGAFALIAFHLLLVYSTVAFLAVIGWGVAMLALWLVRRRKTSPHRQADITTLLLALLPGLLVPFMLVRMPNVAVFLVAEDVLNKGSNWQSKIGFLELGSALYSRVLPARGEVPSAGHNLILSTYLQFGYLLTLPLLVFIWRFLRHAIAGTPFALAAGAMLVLVTHLLVVPTQLFYPTGAVFVMAGFGLTYHCRQPQ